MDFFVDDGDGKSTTCLVRRSGWGAGGLLGKAGFTLGLSKLFREGSCRGGWLGCWLDPDECRDEDVE